MRQLTTVLCALAMAGALQAADIGGKVAFGFEQGVGIAEGSGDALGRGLSFKLCLSNYVAVKGALGFNFSNTIVDQKNDLGNATLYHEDKARVDYTAAAYGILVFRRFEKVHLNGMTGLLIAYRDNHFESESEEAMADTGYSYAVNNLNEPSKKTDMHLRVLLAPEIFLFPNFSLEYKYGFDIALKKETLTFNQGTAGNPDYVIREPRRLFVDVIGDLNLLQSASVHFYF